MLDQVLYDITQLIGHVNEYPTMQYYGNPRHIESIVAYMSLTEYFWKFQWKVALLTDPIDAD